MKISAWVSGKGDGVHEKVRIQICTVYDRETWIRPVQQGLKHLCSDSDSRRRYPSWEGRHFQHSGYAGYRLFLLPCLL